MKTWSTKKRVGKRNEMTSGTNTFIGRVKAGNGKGAV